MILGKIIQRIQSAYSKGVQDNDSELTSRHIYSKIVSVRSRILNRLSNKKQKINLSNYQTFSCIEVIQVAEEDCPCVPPDGCSVFRTRVKLPRVVTDINKNLIDWVISPDNSIVYNETTKDKLRYSKGNRFTSTVSKYLIDNDYLYLYGNNISDTIKVRLIAEDPWEAHKLLSCSGSYSICDSPFDFEFPLDADLEETLIEMSFQELLGIFGQEVSNNTNENAENQ